MDPDDARTTVAGLAVALATSSWIVAASLRCGFGGVASKRAVRLDGLRESGFGTVEWALLPFLPRRCVGLKAAGRGARQCALRSVRALRLDPVVCSFVEAGSLAPLRLGRL